MQLEMADFAPGAATWQTHPNSVIRRLTCAITWRAGWNTCIVFDSGPFAELCDNIGKTGTTQCTAMHYRLRKNKLRPQSTENLVKFWMH